MRTILQYCTLEVKGGNWRIVLFRQSVERFYHYAGGSIIAVNEVVLTEDTVAESNPVGHGLVLLLFYPATLLMEKNYQNPT